MPQPRLSRRQILAGMATLPAFPSLAQANGTPQLLRLMPSTQQIAPEGYPATDLWTINGRLPGEALHAAQGDRLRVTVQNDLPQPSALHWHGIRIQNTMDGVPGITQDPIAPGARFDYDFALPDAGTYWYHSHAQAIEQVERGLQGPLIVNEAEAPDVDQDLTLMLDDMRLTREAAISEGFDNGHDLSHGGRLGNVLLTNGTMQAAYPVQQGNRLRLRLINSANARIFTLGLQGLRGWIMALDGMPLPAPQNLPDRITLAPAQRVDLFVDVTAAAGEDAFLIHFDRDGGFEQARFLVSGAGTARPAPPPLPPNPDFPIDLTQARNVDLTMEGGAMAWLQKAQLDGVALDGRALAQIGKFWAFNGHVGRPAEPLVTANLGETIRVTLRNTTRWPHAMHLHGMHFAEVLPDGQLGPLRDTLLMQPGDTRDIAFQAHNPGDWLFHCHMLGHHMAGMGTWVRVLG